MNTVPATKAQNRYWALLGGEYADTGFVDLVAGAEEERLGPFTTYKAAHDAWQARSWATVDTATRRYRIVEETAV